MSDSFTHRVLPYDGMDDYLAGALPFLRAGAASGDRVLAVTPVAAGLLLRGELGAAAAGIEFHESAAWYSHPARTLAGCLDMADAAEREGRRLRILGEPGWNGRPAPEVLEWQRTEALVNVAFAGTATAILCPYARSLPAGVVASSRRTHPESVRGVTAVRNPGYLDPWTFSARCDGEPLPAPPPDAESMALDRPDLYWLRAYAGDFARRAGLPAGDVQRLLVAATEVVTNAVRHGAPPMTLTMWTDPADGSVVCQVTDAGRWPAAAGHGLVPPRSPGPPGAARGNAAGPGRFGLWAVRLLCSAVQIRTGEQGTTVRLRLRPPAVPAGTAQAVDTA
ncbi:anti-sigma factor RsbA family regulatory protein [Actinomadura sp. 21ATH]|uniref:anti-sigma factor RsbA family regulatory protein n=1 Tax=Actinomadura sp. 21ATH TaxID=1735444 RepID=UPI0035C12A05